MLTLTISDKEGYIFIVDINKKKKKSLVEII